jgi:hypothetical protein
MITISRFFTKRIMVVFSTLSDSCPAGGGKQQEGQDEQGTDHQPGHRRRQPVHLQLVGHHHREGELEQVVVGRARKLRPEERRKPALAQQRELVGMLVRRGAVVWTHVGFSW